MKLTSSYTLAPTKDCSNMNSHDVGKILVSKPEPQVILRICLFRKPELSNAKELLLLDWNNWPSFPQSFPHGPKTTFVMELEVFAVFGCYFTIENHFISCSVQVFILFQRRPTWWHTVRGGMKSVSGAPELTFILRAGNVLSCQCWEETSWSEALSAQSCQGVRAKDTSREFFLVEVPACCLGSQIPVLWTAFSEGKPFINSITREHGTVGKVMAWMKIQKL